MGRCKNVLTLRSQKEMHDSNEVAFDRGHCRPHMSASSQFPLLKRKKKKRNLAIKINAIHTALLNEINMTAAHVLEKCGSPAAKAETAKNI